MTTSEFPNGCIAKRSLLGVARVTAPMKPTRTPPNSRTTEGGPRCPGGGLDIRSEAGVESDEIGFPSNRSFVNYAGINSAGKYVYSLGTLEDFVTRQAAGESQWAVQVTLKYEF